MLLPLDEENSLVTEETSARNEGSLEEEEFEKDRWDEGGRSDCGYTDTIHDTLMSLGGWMHGIFGEPSDGMKGRMKGIGNYFQEASYALRDFRRGTLEKGEFKFKTDDLEIDDIENDGEATDDDGHSSDEEEENL